MNVPVCITCFRRHNAAASQRPLSAVMIGYIMMSPSGPFVGVITQCMTLKRTAMWKASSSNAIFIQPIRLLGMIHCFFPTNASIKFVFMQAQYMFYSRSYTWSALTYTDALTHWGRVTHICVGKLINIGSDNGLSPVRHQAIIWNNAGILLIGPLGTNVSEILIEIQTLSLRKIRLKMSSAKCRPFCPGLNVITYWGRDYCNLDLAFVVSRMCSCGLTHWGRDKMDVISQTTFSSAFSWMKMFEFRLKFHWSLFLRIQLTIAESSTRIKPIQWWPIFVKGTISEKNVSK